MTPEEVKPQMQQEQQRKGNMEKDTRIELTEERVREIVREEVQKRLAEQAAFSLRLAWGEEAFARFLQPALAPYIPARFAKENA